MARKLSFWFLTTVLVFGVSCASKKKSGEGEGLEGDGAAISSSPMDFDPTGSDSGKIDGLGTINFAYDSASIDSDARKTLASNAGWMKTNAKYSVQIEGHCDSRGSVEYNLALGERRAKSVRDYLTSLGVDKKRLSIISYGKEKPLDLGDTEAVHARNRRANFVPLQN
jgi:peptidoglycan-associated lipoprotein